ncbi:hypothetical protein ACH5RR_011613 [Cinchona calisaya]|uniref:Pectinesterase n=1 Tax=Cinchona calisaya TaxID=153742 RepID=A0ABD3A7Y4_9GENT
MASAFGYSSPVTHDLSTFFFNATVSKSRPGAYRTVMDAIAKAPTHSRSRYYIHVEAAVYNEIVLVPKSKTNIALIGDGADVTKITMNRKVPDFQTWQTATVSVLGEGFMAQYIAFENSAGECSQAVAFMSKSEESSFYKCSFIGYHDTVYARAGKQFYRECDIYGTVDFIFGNAAAVFQRCNLYARQANRVITFTAQGKKEDGKKSGFVIQYCNLTTAPQIQSSKNTADAYLGRPWFSLSTVVVMQSFLDDIINPAGWFKWSGHSTNKVTYREYNNWGPGAAVDGRVSWQGYRILNQSSEVMQFTVGQFINGDSWIPETGIPYTSGL